MKKELYEDLYSDVKHILNVKKRRLNINNVNNSKSDRDPETITTDSNYNNSKIYLDDKFIKKLIKYLDKQVGKSFPDSTELKTILTVEIRKIVKTGNDKELKKVVEKIRDIILRERIKFIDNVEKKVSNILIDKR